MSFANIKKMAAQTLGASSTTLELLDGFTNYVLGSSIENPKDEEIKAFSETWTKSNRDRTNKIDIDDLYEFAKSFYRITTEPYQKFFETESKLVVEAKIARIRTKTSYYYSLNSLKNKLNNLTEQTFQKPYEECATTIKELATRLQEQQDNYQKLLGLEIVQFVATILQEDNSVPYSSKKEALTNIFKDNSIVKDDLTQLKKSLEYTVYLTQKMVSMDSSYVTNLNGNKPAFSLNDVLSFNCLKQNILKLYRKEIETLFEIDQVISTTLSLELTSLNLSEGMVSVELDKKISSGLSAQHITEHRRNTSIEPIDTPKLQK